MSQELKAYYVIRVAWELASYRWKGSRNALATAWQMTFDDGPVPAAPLTTVHIPKGVVTLDDGTPWPRERVTWEVHRKYRFAIHWPGGQSEIRSLGSKDGHNFVLESMAQGILKRLSWALGVKLD